MRKLQHIILSFCLMLGLLYFPNIEAYASNVTLGVNKSKINIGDTVTVTVKVPESVSATVDITYSSDVLSFVSASADVGTNGSTITMNIGKYSLAASDKITVKFKAATSGTANISASVISAVDNATAEEVSLGGASTSVTVKNQSNDAPEDDEDDDDNDNNDDDDDDDADQPSTPPADQPSAPPSGNEDAPKSADNSLASLKLSSGTLSPSFRYNVTNYTATVGYDVTSVVVSATPSNGNAVIESVTGNGNVNLQVGENTIQIVVKAENGVKATYTIVVTREAEGDTTPIPPEDDSSESETPDAPTTDETEVLQWNGQELQPAENIPNDIVPTDFTVNTVMINSVEVPCLTFVNGDLRVLYLADEEGTAGLYIYDEVQQMVYPFVKVEFNDNYVVVLVPDGSNVPAPENYKACTLSIEGKGVINAYQFVQLSDSAEQTSWFGPETFYAAEPVATDFYLIYCMNNLGEKGWYVYDSVEGTVQRYLGSVHNPIIESEVETEGTLDEISKGDYDRLQAKLEQAKKLQMAILCIAAIIIVVFVIVIVVLILKKRSDDEFDDDEYYDEYEFEEDEDTTEEINQTTDTDVEDEEIEIEFYEMSQEETKAEEDDEIEIEFYEMPQEETETEEDDDEIEIEFYEMSPEEIEDDDEVEVEFYDMEELLMKEAIAPEKESSKNEEKIPEKSQVIDTDEDDDDLEFIELD